MTHLKQIGAIPEWIKQAKPPSDYANPLQLIPEAETIYGTERLCGDWNGEVLLLAKDFAPVGEVQRVLAAGYSPDLAYRHNDGDGRYKTGYRTNSRLMRWLFDAPQLVDGRHASTCRCLYGSACFFLKPGDTSDALQKWSPGNWVFDQSTNVTMYVIEQMKKRHLKAVVCMGGDALEQMFHIEQLGPSPGISGAIGKKFGRELRIFAVPHPSRGSNASHLAAWRFVRDNSGATWIGTVPQ